MAQLFRYPQSSLTISAIGNNGLPAPITSIQVGAEDPSGDLQPLQVDASGNLKVDITSASGSPIDVDVVSSVLPTGAATEAKQDTANTSLASIDTKLTAPLSVTGPLTDAELRATPVDVDTGLLQALTDAQLRATPVPISGSITTNGLTDAELRASPVAVSAASLPLPTGAATSANQTNGTQKSQLVDAAGDSVDVVPLGTPIVTLDKGLVTNTVIHGLTTGGGGAYVDVKVNPSGALTVEASVTSSVLPTGAATAANQTTANASLSSIDSKLTSPLAVTGPLTDAQLRATPVPVSGTITASNPSVSAVGAATPASATYIAGNDGANLRPLKVDGTGVLSVDGSAVTQPVSAASLPLPSGAATEAKQDAGNLSLTSIDSKINSDYGTTGTAVRTAAQIGNASGAADFGAGAAGAQTLRVVQASGGAAPSASAGRAKASAPILNNYASTPVTSAAYVQLVASTTSAANMIEIFDSSGETLYLAVGAAASEVDQLIIIPGGNGQVPIAIPASSRISVKATSTSATVGILVINLYT